LTNEQVMDAEKESRKCLICSVPINECRLGVDCCRACAVFFRRIRSGQKGTPTECLRGGGKCFEEGRVTSCRMCRFDRFAVVLKMADSNNVDETLIVETEKNIVISPTAQTCRPVETRGAMEEDIDQTQFIDHNTFLLDLPSSSFTPVLDKIRWSYSLMCQTLKTAETGTKPASFPLTQGDHDGSNIRFVPASYSMVVPNRRVFLSALYDFARMTFPDFSELETENKKLCVSGCMHMVSMMVATYRGVHYYPTAPDVHFMSYTTFVNDESIESFLDDCPSVINKEEAIGVLKETLRREKSMSRQLFQRLRPDNVEFTALLGLAFWNNSVSHVNEELSVAVQKNRARILKEMHEVYKGRRKTDYASRLGELLSLLDNMQECATLCMQDVEVYRLFNLLNEDRGICADHDAYRQYNLFKVCADTDQPDTPVHSHH
ncbi:hypothetical protein PENTCL1PPCAC_21444, partial [Pristionchus entomophagus]